MELTKQPNKKNSQFMQLLLEKETFQQRLLTVINPPKSFKDQ